MAGLEIQQVRGDWQRASRKLRDAGKGEFKRNLRKLIVTETLSLRKDIKQAALDKLPQGGGLNRWAAVLPAAVLDLRAGSESVRIVDRKSGHDLKALDDGQVRHPVYGNRKAWARQQIAPGFFTDTVQEKAPEVVARVEAGMIRYADKMWRQL